MEPGESRRPAQAGIPTQVSVTIAEPGWRRMVPRAEALARRAALAAGRCIASQGRSGQGVPGPGKSASGKSGAKKSARGKSAPGKSVPENFTPVAAGPGASVVLAGDRAVRLLNARHRGRNKPTNVLTYDPPMPGLPGEIILALGTIRREAASQRRQPAHHLAHLVVHGTLHLAGYDHGRAGEARRMEMAEARILHRLRVPNPWKRA